MRNSTLDENMTTHVFCNGCLIGVKCWMSPIYWPW